MSTKNINCIEIKTKSIGVGATISYKICQLVFRRCRGRCKGEVNTEF